MSGNLGPLPLDNAENCKCWLVSFEALCRTKSIEDTLTKHKNSPKTDKFLEMCGTKSLLKVLTLLPGKNIEEVEFKSIKEKIVEYIEPKKRLVIADRTNFLSIKQNEGESYKDFLSRLNEASVLCKWEELKSGDPADEMIKLKFIEGLKDEAMKLKVLEQIQTRSSVSLTDIVDFCQMCAQMSSFVGAENSTQPNEPATAFYVAKKNFFVLDVERDIYQNLVQRIKRIAISVASQVISLKSVATSVSKTSQSTLALRSSRIALMYFLWTRLKNQASQKI